jgi:hypothetical protein
MLMKSTGKEYSFDRFILSSVTFFYLNVKFSAKGRDFFYQKSHEMRVGYQGDEEVSIVSQAGVEERKNTKKG